MTLCILHRCYFIKNKAFTFFTHEHDTVDCDYVVVGSGFTGGVLARQLHDAGFKVIVVERRNHIGGNVFDYRHQSGILIHRYGPHLFRTSSDRIWSFVNQFSDFYKYEHYVHTLVDGKYENWPLLGSYIKKTVGKDWKPPEKRDLSNFESACLSMMPEEIYRKFVKGYTEKQWGVEASTLDAKLAGRFDVRWDEDRRFKQSRYQGLPVKGYSELMLNLFKGIPVLLNFDFLENKYQFQPKRGVLFTGPVDSYFDYKEGKLGYRGQERAHTYLPEKGFHQSAPVVNYPESGTPFIRSIEWKQFLPEEEASRIFGTILTTETPFTPDNPDHFEYPFPDQKNRDLYLRYREQADKIPEVLFCGRLGEYRYLDMDQAIARALLIAERLLEAHSENSSRNPIDAVKIRLRGS